MTEITASEKQEAAQGLETTGLVGDTYVILKNGERRELQFVGQGEEVLSRCVETGEIGYKKIVACFLHERIPTYYIFYANQDGTRLPVEATAGVSFWVKGKGWTRVNDLHSGDIVESFDGAQLTADYVECTGSRADVYNLEIERFHTYFVGYEGLWIHSGKHSSRFD